MKSRKNSISSAKVPFLHGKQIERREADDTAKSVTVTHLSPAAQSRLRVISPHWLSSSHSSVHDCFSRRFCSRSVG